MVFDMSVRLIFVSLKKTKHMTKLFSQTLCLAFLFITINSNGGNQTTFQFAPGITQKDYLPNTLIIKVKSAYRTQCSNTSIEVQSLQQIFSSINANSISKIFPNHLPPIETLDQYGRPYVDLSLIYQLEYTNNVDMVKTINRLLATDVLEYAEPKYLPTTQYSPNDPSIASQQFLIRINADSAWDVTKGDTNVVIGIIDTGSDLDHPDLVANLKMNYNDPINGLDDDNDGYVDNFNGWDLGENDNNATVNGNTHGSHVSGCAAAVTDNGIGVASPGFYCKFLPVKISNASGSLTTGYEGIVYAADHGCDIINCSWGGGGGGSLGQNSIDYATINKDALVVCAAGNNSTNQLFYPAAYNYVLCIAATNNVNDIKASFSNYGSYIDVCAPGNGINSTFYNNTYSTQSGTSMASPIAAGCAAIVKSQFPTYNALQVGEKLRITADNIYGLGPNASYLATRGLGTGRVNLYHALTQSSTSVRMHPIIVSDNNDNIFVIGDTLRITGDFTNYLDATTNLVATISVASNPTTYVNIIDNSTTLGALATMAVANNNADPFTMVINPNAPQNASITLKITLQDGAYTDYVMFDVVVNVDYINITTNEVYTTNSSKGRICYNANLSTTEGLGFTLNPHTSFAYETGLMIGVAGKVSDVVRDATSANEDFVSVNPIQKNDPGIWSDFDTYGKFNDNGAAAGSRLNVDVNYRSFTWSAAPDSRYHIFEYTIYNNGTTPLNALYAGIFSDWDVPNYGNNKADEDVVQKMGYVWSTDSNFYAGIKLLTSAPWNHYALDNLAGGGGGIDISAGFSSAQKYQALSTGRATAGGTGTGNDVCDVVSTGPFNLNVGDSVRVAFALVAGESLTELITNGEAAQVKYDVATGISEVISSNGVEITTVYPNPVNDVASFNLNLQKAQQLEIAVFDVLGNKVATLVNGWQASGVNNYTFDTSTWSNGVYMLYVRGADAQLSTRFVVAE